MSKPRTSSDPKGAVVQGQIFVLSAPSGGGKSTLAERVRARTPHVARATTCTTRLRRPGEEDGRDYYFLSSEDFERRRQAGELLEWASVHGFFYGTPRAEVERLCAQGLDVLLVIDYQGAATLRQQKVEAVYTYILPPSLAELERRLRQRNLDDETTLRRRLARAPQEMAYYCLYDYVIVNDDVEVATQQLQAIILADRCRVSRLGHSYPIFTELDGWVHE